MGCTHSACACFWSIWFLLLHVGLSFSGIFKISYNIPSFLYIFRLPSMFCLRNVSLGMFKNFPWSVTLLWGEVMEDMGRALSTRKGSRGQSTLLYFLVLCLWQVAWPTSLRLSFPMNKGENIHLCLLWRLNLSAWHRGDISFWRISYIIYLEGTVVDWPDPWPKIMGYRVIRFVCFFLKKFLGIFSKKPSKVIECRHISGYWLPLCWCVFLVLDHGQNQDAQNQDVSTRLLGIPAFICIVIPISIQVSCLRFPPVVFSWPVRRHHLHLSLSFVTLILAESFGHLGEGLTLDL